MADHDDATAAHDVNELLRLAEPLLIRIVRQRLRGQLAEHRDDFAQTVRVHLWRYSLPRFDPAKGAFPAFIRTCVDQVLTNELQKLGREPDAKQAEFDALAPDADLDVERLADQIRTDPEAYLTRTQARVFRMLAAGADRHDIAAKLGIEPDTVSQICWRMKRRVVELAA